MDKNSYYCLQIKSSLWKDFET